MVVLYHFEANVIPQVLYDNFLIRQSYMFVDFFFVLSGFVIGINYFNLNTFQLSKIFLKKRFIRLYPLLVYTVIVFLLVESIGPMFFPDAFENSNSTTYNLKLTVDSLFFLNSTPIFGSDLGMNYPSWSISAEMISYGVYSLGLIWFRKKVFTIFVVILTSLIFLIFNKIGFTVGGDFGFIRGLYSFFIGVLACKFYSRFRYNFCSIHELLSVMSIIFLLYAINIDISPSIRYLAPVTFGFFIYVFSMSKGFISAFLEKPFLILLGNISYSIYLNHAIIILVLPRLTFRYFELPRTNLNLSLVLILTLLVVIIYSWFTYKIVEKKGGKLLKNIISRSH